MLMTVDDIVCSTIALRCARRCKDATFPQNREMINRDIAGRQRSPIGVCGPEAIQSATFNRDATCDQPPSKPPTCWRRQTGGPESGKWSDRARSRPRIFRRRLANRFAQRSLLRSRTTANDATQVHTQNKESGLDGEHDSCRACAWSSYPTPKFDVGQVEQSFQRVVDNEYITEYALVYTTSVLEAITRAIIERAGAL